MNCALICQDHHTPSTLWCTSEKTASCCAARGSRSLWWATPPPAPTGGYVHKGVLAGEPPGGKIADFFTFTRIFHARRRRGTPRASDASCVSAVERPRERLPCRPPGRLRAGAPLQPASWPHRLSSLLSKLFPFIRAAAVGRSRPAESSTSLFDRLGVTHLGALRCGCFRRTLTVEYPP